MATRFRLSILSVLTVFILAAVGLYLTRLPIAGWSLEQILNQQGIEARFTVSAVQYNRLLIEDLVVGPGADLAVETLELVFHPGEIFSGKVRTVTISDMVLRIDATKDTIEIIGLPIGANQGVAERPVFDLTFPAIDVRNSKLLVLTPSGEVEADFSADIQNGESGALILSSEISLAAESFGNASASLDATLEERNRLFGDVSIEDGNLKLPSFEVAGLSGHLTYELLIDHLPSLVAEAEFQAATLTLRQSKLPISAFPDARISARIDSGRVTIEGDVAAEDGSLQGKTRIALANFLDGGSLEGETSVRLAAPSTLPAVFGLPEPDRGTLDMNFSLTGQSPGLFQSSMSLARLPSELMAEGLALKGKAALSDLSIPGWVSLAQADLSIAGTLNEHRLAIETQEPFRLLLSGVNEARLAAASLPPSIISAVREGVIVSAGTAESPAVFVYEHDDSAPRASISGPLNVDTLVGGIAFASGVSIDVSEGSVHDISLENLVADVPHIRLSGQELRDLRVSGNASGNLDDLSADLLLYGTSLATSLGTFAVEHAQFEVPISAHIDQASVRIVSKSDARIEMRGLSGPAELTTSAPIIFKIEELEGLLPRSDLANIEISGIGRLDATSFQAQIDDEQMQVSIAPISFQVSGNRIGLPESQVVGELTSDSLGVSGKYPADLMGITGLFDIHPSTMELTFEISIEEAKLESLDHLVLPFGVHVDVSRDAAGAIKLDATPVWGNELRPISISVQMLPDPLFGALRAELAPITFSRSGLQLKDLSPLAQHFEKFDATIAGEMSLDWQGGRSASQGRLSVVDGSFISKGISIEGLATELTLKSLWPVETPPNQRVSAEKLDLGIPLSHLEAIFAAHSGHTGAPVIELTKSSFDMLGSTINIRPQVYNVEAEENPFVIDVLHLDLAKLFAFVSLEGVDGSGKIDGTVPIKLSPEGVAIENGRLASVEPGRLQIRSATVRAYLANYDENVDLLMEALEDFHYETLTVEIDKTASEDLIARLSVLGRNPKVLDGRSFQLNIQLDSNIEQLMNALLEGYRISNEALKRAWGLIR